MKLATPASPTAKKSGSSDAACADVLAEGGLGGERSVAEVVPERVVVAGGGVEGGGVAVGVERLEPDAVAGQDGALRAAAGGARG
jgi:hypothetical protein